MTEKLTLKWGTLKAWRLESDESLALIQEYIAVGSALAATQQHDTPRQKDIICEIIDLMPGTILNGWSGEEMTHDDAKAYVRNYGKDRPAP